MKFDTDFQEEFNRIMDDPSVLETDKDFTRLETASYRTLT
jgi:hypothetical protein